VLPKPVVGESFSGMGFKVFFESQGCGLFFEGEIGD
jgi:hypothetical protein